MKQSTNPSAFYKDSRLDARFVNLQAEVGDPLLINYRYYDVSSISFTMHGGEQIYYGCIFDFVVTQTP